MWSVYSTILFSLGATGVETVDVSLTCALVVAAIIPCLALVIVMSVIVASASCPQSSEESTII